VSAGAVRWTWPLPPREWSLEPGEVHVWCADLDQLAAVLPAAALSADERERERRIRVPQVRTRFAAGRGWLRERLARYLGTDPARIEFGRGPGGKPKLASGGALHFNLSHAGAVALLAVSRVGELGVDVEAVDAHRDLEELAERTCTARERELLRGAAPDERPALFHRLWTRKEAFGKATGAGLASDPRRIAAGDPAPAVAPTPLAGTPGWVQDLWPCAGHAGALVVLGRPERVTAFAAPVPDLDAGLGILPADPPS